MSPAQQLKNEGGVYYPVYPVYTSQARPPVRKTTFSLQYTLDRQPCPRPASPSSTSTSNIHVQHPRPRPSPPPKGPASGGIKHNRAHGREEVMWDLGGPAWCGKGGTNPARYCMEF
jgi:hypothetical protein